MYALVEKKRSKNRSIGNSVIQKKIIGRGGMENRLEVINSEMMKSNVIQRAKWQLVSLKGNKGGPLWKCVDSAGDWAAVAPKKYDLTEDNIEKIYDDAIDSWEGYGNETDEAITDKYNPKVACVLLSLYSCLKQSEEHKYLATQAEELHHQLRHDKIEGLEGCKSYSDNAEKIFEKFDLKMVEEKNVKPGIIYLAIYDGHVNTFKRMPIKSFNKKKPEYMTVMVNLPGNGSKAATYVNKKPIKIYGI